MAEYKIMVSDAQERTGPGILEPLTGTVYHLGNIVTITEIQKNTPGVAEWGHLANGNWIATIWNGRVRVELVSTPPPPPPPPSGTSTYTATLVDDQTGETWSGTLTKQ